MLKLMKEEESKRPDGWGLELKPKNEEPFQGSEKEVKAAI